MQLPIISFIYTLLIHIHHFVVAIASILVAMLSSLSFFLFISTLICNTQAECPLETASLPRSRGSGNVCIHSTLVVLNICFKRSTTIKILLQITVLLQIIISIHTKKVVQLSNNKQMHKYYLISPPILETRTHDISDMM